MAGEIKRGLGTLIGNAGEYYVMAELLSRGIVAAMTPRNSPGFDVLATNGDTTARIRVKSKREQYTDWQWVVKKDGSIFKNLGPSDDFTVLVNLSPNRSGLHFWIVPTRIVDSWLKADFEEWLAEPGAKGQPRSAANKKRHLNFPRFEERLRPFLEEWNSIWVTANELATPVRTAKPGVKGSRRSKGRS